MKRNKIYLIKAKEIGPEITVRNVELLQRNKSNIVTRDPMDSLYSKLDNYSYKLMIPNN